MKFRQIMMRLTRGELTRSFISSISSFLTKINNKWIYCFQKDTVLWVLKSSNDFWLSVFFQFSLINMNLFTSIMPFCEDYHINLWYIHLLYPNVCFTFITNQRNYLIKFKIHAEICWFCIKRYQNIFNENRSILRIRCFYFYQDEIDIHCNDLSWSIMIYHNPSWFIFDFYEYCSTIH
jgi:hypothetical protein